MLLVACFAVCVALVPVMGGSLTRLASHRFSHSYLLFGALAIQVLIISIVPEGGGWQAAAHVASYLLAVCFLVFNRAVAGLWLIGIGTGMNLTAILVNGGVMPATRSALELAGKLPEPGSFVNSAALAHPKMAFLGDVFAIPAPLPLANVFSAGDVCIVIGAALALFQITQSRVVMQLRERRMGSIDPL
jgi:Family of unknown function (DUF5317)